jgi:FkbM family methyltransferase
MERRHGAAVVAGQWADALLPLLDHTLGQPAPDAPSVSWLARGLRAEVRNWLPLGLLGWIVLPSRLPPRRGLLHRRIGQRKVTVRLRSGQTVTCRVAELFAVTEVFAVATYDRAGFDWAAARTIVDVGANIGAATVWMAGRAPHARVVAVEPSPHALPLLRENVAANGLTDRVTIVPCAIAAAPGTVRLSAAGTSVSGRVVADGTPPSGGDDLVAARTLPSVLRDAGVETVDILKLDCEGAEFDIIETMGPADLARVGAIVGEYHTFNGRQPRELRPPLAAAGFIFSWSGGGEIGTFAALRPAPPPAP